MDQETEVETVEDTTVDQADAQAAFDAAFDGKVPTATPEPTEEPEQEEAKPEPEPEYAQITKAELADLMAKASRVDGAYGEIGGIKRKLNEMQATPEGQSVVFTADDFPELAKEYPELIGAHVKDMNKALGKFKVPKADPAVLDRIVNERVSATRKELMDSHFDGVVGGDWVAEVNSDGFKKWAQTQPAELVQSESVRDVSGLLRSWRSVKETAKPAPKTYSRKQQLEAAITPKGTGGGHQSNHNTDAAMQAAFDAQFKD